MLRRLGSRAGIAVAGALALTLSSAWVPAAVPTVGASGSIAVFSTIVSGLYQPVAVAVATDGNVFIADAGLGKILEWSPATQHVTQLAIPVAYPTGIAVGPDGNLYISDAGLAKVLEYNMSTGTTVTLAGTGTAGYNGDNIPAQTAEVNVPLGLAVDASGNVFFVDRNNNEVREIQMHNGVPGNIIDVASPSGSPLVYATLNYMGGLAIGPQGNLYIANSGDNQVLEVNLQTRTVTTVAGTGVYGYTGDSGLATQADLAFPVNVAVDAYGDIFISDRDNSALREVSPSGTITTVQATKGNLFLPNGVAVGPSGDIFIVNAGFNTVDEVHYVSPPLSFLEVTTAATHQYPMGQVLPTSTGSVGQFFFEVLHSQGGVGYAIWSLKSGALPPGLKFDPSGALIGIPTQAGTYTFSVQATDLAGSTLTHEITVTISQ